MCSAAFSQGTLVTLTATPGSGSTFAGWGGSCSGTGGCNVALDSSASVTASFNAAGAGNCTSNSTTLCLPGDNRFRVSVFFQTTQGGGSSGNAQAIPLDSLGTSAGGLFYFTNPTDPQFLVKIIDGCGLNNRFWVFYAATTNVGFDLTVTDTLANQTKVYRNADRNAADPIQDSSAFATCP